MVPCQSGLRLLICWRARGVFPTLPDTAGALGKTPRKAAVFHRKYAVFRTHKELHVAAVIDAGETVLGTRSFSTTGTGYRALPAWVGGFGDLALIGVEGTGSCGAGLTRHVAKAGVMILEVAVAEYVDWFQPPAPSQRDRPCPASRIRAAPRRPPGKGTALNFQLKTSPQNPRFATASFLNSPITVSAAALS